MQNITKYVLFIVLALTTQFIQAQEANNSVRIKILKEQKDKITTEERDFLKTEVATILERLKNGEITEQKADSLKKAAARKRALNIENRTAILTNKISLLERNEKGYYANDEVISNEGISIAKNGTFVEIKSKENNQIKRYDRRTYNEIVVAIGLNNAIIKGEAFDDSPYKYLGSRFFELGWAWKTRVFKNTNFMRFKYGFSLQFNGLKPTDNRFFVQNGDVTSLEVFEGNLNKSKLNITNLVMPIHFEFGPSKKTVNNDTYFRYSTYNQFKFGIGGYAGFNIGTRQKLKYTIDGDKGKDKIKQGYNASDLVYGLSSYVAFGSAAVYVKYDLSPIFKDQAIKQNNISLGIRFDME
ncbi:MULTISPECIES: hypothetical protein [Flavobacteriaceae]|uniref:PorT family protein n=2 Tax=Flavobacteriaceae TaxID=49546 RepID=A0A4Y8APJ9_9FLAO|nr:MULTISPECIES: hypothetical protein [Flavobacteriaceae]TEW72545.1 hypothetical protein E2488_13935 [Gramella jeungdoensis]GGK54832.1 hypothetical protein GCM10007963_23960 [Lutibacter litoralis]